MMSHNPSQSIQSTSLAVSLVRLMVFTLRGFKTIKGCPTVANRTDVVCTYDTRACFPIKASGLHSERCHLVYLQMGLYDTHAHTAPWWQGAAQQALVLPLAPAALAVEANIQIKPLLAVASLCTRG